MNPIEYIEDNGKMLALIVRASFSHPGIKFFTEDSLSQQLAYMKHPKGKCIDPHVHNSVRREVHFTQEVLVIKKGILRVDFFNSDQVYLTSRELRPWDVVMLIEGGHGFEVLEDIEILEVKQGPYAGDNDKIRFESKVNPEDVTYE